VTATRPSTSTDTALEWAAALFTVVVLLHGADHLRRGLDATGRSVFWLGTFGIVLEAGVVVLVCQRHRLAPLASAVVGFTLAAGYLAVHFLPAHPFFSDSFTSKPHISPLSWAAASAEVAAALILGAVGLSALRERGGLAGSTRPHPGGRPLAEALRHPVAAVMLVGQAALLVIAFTHY
jgi:hypothetical protein